MKKLLSLLLVLTISLTACGKKETTTSDASNNDANASRYANVEPNNSEITIWHSYTKAQEEALTNSVEKFNAENGLGIKVKLESQDSKGFEGKVKQAIRAGNGPDLIIHFSTAAAEYVRDDLVVDFEELIANEKFGIPNYLDGVNPNTIKEVDGFTDGKMHVFPLVSSGPIFFYNQDLYNELGLSAPKTWNDVFANAEKIKAAHPDKYGFAADSLPDYAQTLISQNNNGEVFNKELKTTFATNEKVIAAVAKYGEAVSKGLYMNAPTGQYFSEDFNSGLLASYIGSVAGVPYISLPNLGLAPMPQTEGGTPFTPAWNRGAIVFKSTPEKELAAFLFVKHFASPEQNALFCKAANYISPYSATREHQIYQDFIKDAKGLEHLQAEIAGAYAPVSGTSSLREDLKAALSEVAGGIKDAKTALSDAATSADMHLAESNQ